MRQFLLNGVCFLAIATSSPCFAQDDFNALVVSGDRAPSYSSDAPNQGDTTDKMLAGSAGGYGSGPIGGSPNGN